MVAAPAFAPMVTAGEAVASAMGQQVRVSQMVEALVAARPIMIHLDRSWDHQVVRALALIDAALTAAPVTEVRYGRWLITFDPPPIPTRNCDWSFTHDDFGGPGDRRSGHAPSLPLAMAEIDLLEEDARR